MHDIHLHDLQWFVTRSVPITSLNLSRETTIGSLTNSHCSGWICCATVSDIGMDSSVCFLCNTCNNIHIGTHSTRTHKIHINGKQLLRRSTQACVRNTDDIVNHTPLSFCKPAFCDRDHQLACKCQSQPCSSGDWCLSQSISTGYLHLLACCSYRLSTIT